jgi:perosamine synthetase
MAGLIPAEYWEYNLFDFWSSLGSIKRSDSDNELINIEGVGDCIPARSARAAIYLAIKALNLPAGSRIAVPLYCCPVVFKSVHKANCVHRFIDIDPSTGCMSAADLAKKIKEIDAVIAVHMFGNVCNILVLKEVAQGKPIIEDCAQSIGSMIADKATGTFGTISAFSFRSGKYLSVGEGGALFTEDKALKKKLRMMTSELPAPTFSNELIHMASTYIRTKLRRRPLYGLVGVPLWRYYNKTTDYTLKSPIIFSKMYGSDVKLVRKRMGNLPEAIKNQRLNADHYSSSLKMKPEMLYREEPGMFYNRYLFPIIFSSTKVRDFVAEYLFKHGIGTAKPYHDIVSVASTHYGYEGDCNAAEKLANGVLVVPSYVKLRAKVIENIAARVNEAYSRAANQDAQF